MNDLKSELSGNLEECLLANSFIWCQMLEESYEGIWTLHVLGNNATCKILLQEPIMVEYLGY